MKIHKKSFQDLITPLQYVIQENHVVPVLRCVKLDFSPEKILATGENLESSCSTNIKMEHNINKTVCINYSLLMSAIKSLNDEYITFIFLTNVIKIKHTKGEFKFPLLSSKEFPVQKKDVFDKVAKINSKAFKNSIKVANKFILEDNVSPIGNISISLGKKIHIRSTDRNRLFEEKIKGKGDNEEILISGKSSICLYSLIEDSEDLKIKYNSHKVYFSYSNMDIVIIQQQGNFPLAVFSKVIDCIENAKPLKLNLKEFITAIKRVSVFSSKDKAPTVRLNFTKKELLIHCKSELLETSAEEIIPVEFSQKKIIGYNYKYLIEILSIFEKEPELYVDERNILFIKQGKKIGSLAPVMLVD